MRDMMFGWHGACCSPSANHINSVSIMELYFKDLEGDGENGLSLEHLGADLGASGEPSAEEIAFAELTERVSAARLVY
jgi:hypothetical protein